MWGDRLHLWWGVEDGAQSLRGLCRPTEGHSGQLTPGLSPWQLGQEGKVPLQSAHLYYNVTEKVRRVMESYFRLDAPLYFSYSHLVCRTAIEGGPSPPCSFHCHTCCARALAGCSEHGREQDMVLFTLVREPTQQISAAEEVTVSPPKESGGLLRRC